MASNKLHNVLTEKEIEAELGQALKTFPRTSFDLKDVPTKLHSLTPYAEFWGQADDSVRESILRKTPVSLQENLKWVVSTHEDQLDTWLAGPESSSPGPSDAYIAFSSMRMSADMC